MLLIMRITGIKSSKVNMGSKDYSEKSFPKSLKISQPATPGKAAILWCTNRIE